MESNLRTNTIPDVDYTKEQLKELWEYFNADRPDVPFEHMAQEYGIAEVLAEAEYSFETLLGTYKDQGLSLQDSFRVYFSSLGEISESKASMTYFLVKTLSLKQTDLPLYINSEQWVVRLIVLWRLAKGY